MDNVTFEEFTLEEGIYMDYIAHVSIGPALCLKVRATWDLGIGKGYVHFYMDDEAFRFHNGGILDISPDALVDLTLEDFRYIVGHDPMEDIALYDAAHGGRETVDA